MRQVAVRLIESAGADRPCSERWRRRRPYVWVRRPDLFCRSQRSRTLSKSELKSGVRWSAYRSPSNEQR